LQQQKAHSRRSRQSSGEINVHAEFFAAAEGPTNRARNLGGCGKSERSGVVALLID